MVAARTKRSVVRTMLRRMGSRVVGCFVSFTACSRSHRSTYFPVLCRPRDTVLKWLMKFRPLAAVLLALTGSVLPG